MLEFITKRILSGWHGRTARFVLPPVVYEVAPGFLAGARLEGAKRKARAVRQVALEAIQTQTLDPHLSHANVADGEGFRRAASSLIAAVGNGGGRYGLLLPDGAVRVGIMTFETLPDDSEETEALIRWRMKDKLPYNAEEARVTFQVLSREAKSIEILAIAMRSSVIAEYEAVFASVNGGASLILPATMALLPLLPEREPRGQLLLHICGNWLTAVVVAGSRPCVWRTRELDPRDAAHLSQEVASEAVRVLASARDRLQADLGRAWLCARPPAEKDLVTAVAVAVSHEVEVLRPRPELGSLLSANDRSIFDQFGATVAGLIANAG
jgi:type IV pilus assembly protein PilM